MLFKLSNLALTLGYLNLALNNSALEYSWQFFFLSMPVIDIRVYLHEGFPQNQVINLESNQTT